MALPGENMAQEVFQRYQIGHAVIDVFLDLVRIFFRDRLGKAELDQAIAHELFISAFDNTLADVQRDALVLRMGISGRRKDQLAHFSGMIEREQLGDAPAHRMTANNGVLHAKIIANGGSAISKQLRPIMTQRLAGLAGAAMIGNDYPMVP